MQLWDRSRLWIAIAAVAFVSAALGVLYSRRADAQVAAPRECFAVRLYSVSTSESNSGRIASSPARIPPGWTPVGGGQAGTDPVVVLCR